MKTLVAAVAPRLNEGKTNFFMVKLLARLDPEMVTIDRIERS